MKVVTPAASLERALPVCSTCSTATGAVQVLDGVVHRNVDGERTACDLVDRIDMRGDIRMHGIAKGDPSRTACGLDLTACLTQAPAGAALCRRCAAIRGAKRG